MALRKTNQHTLFPTVWKGKAVPGWLNRLQGAVAFLGHNVHRRAHALVGQECSTDDLQNMCLVDGGRDGSGVKPSSQ